MVSLNPPKTYLEKLKNFIDRKTIPSDLTIDDGIRYWQERLLLVFVFAGAILGFFVYIPSVTLSIKEDLWNVAVLDTLIYGWIVFLFFYRSIPFEVRAVTISLISYILGMTLLLTLGPFGGGPVWLFAFPIVVTILLGLRISVLALAVNVMSLIVIGLLLQFGVMEWAYSTVNPVEKWIVSVLNFLLINSVVTLSIALISEGIQGLLKRQKSMLATLQESENKFRKLFEFAPDGFYLSDLEGNFIDGNKAAQKTIGYESAELNGSSLLELDLLSPEDLPKAAELLNESILGRATGPDEFRLKRKDGTTVFVEIMTLPVTIENQKIVLGITRDTTYRKQTEEALQESEDKYRNLIEKLDDIIWIADRDLRVTYVADSIETKLGITPEDFTAQTLDVHLTPASFTCLTEFFIEELKREKDENVDPNRIIRVDLEYYHKNGATLWFENIATWLRDDNGRITGIQGVSRDITERREAEEDKRKLETQLQQAQKMQTIGTLAGGIAHDFNNILFPVFGYLEMMLEDVPENNPLHKKLTEVYNGAIRARDLVQQILTFSRQAENIKKPLKVQLIIKEVLRLIRSSLPVTIDIRQNISNGCALVMADATQIHQITMNLITNAYHAMEEEGGELAVTLKEAEFTMEDLINPSMVPGLHVCLMVTDTGPGMHQSVLDRIFEPYFTTKEEGRGTGLGLAVVHGIVKSHGGHIGVVSKPGMGTEFRVYLPAIKFQETAQQVGIDLPIQKGTERILLVDDEDVIVQMIRQILERLGYHVTARISSTDALEAFRTHPDKFDLVITDMTMPNMTGDKLAGELIKIRSDIPVILCTGFSERMPEEKAAFLGIKGFLLKPVVMKNLADTIREVLDKKK